MEDFNVYRYGTGTSYSTPYLAAAALVAVLAYNLGYRDTGASYSDPSASQIYSMLRNAASRSSDWDQKLGFGYIDLYELYSEAYALGRLNGNPDSGCVPGLPC